MTGSHSVTVKPYQRVKECKPHIIEVPFTLDLSLNYPNYRVFRGHISSKGNNTHIIGQLFKKSFDSLRLSQKTVNSPGPVKTNGNSESGNSKFAAVLRLEGM